LQTTVRRQRSIIAIVGLLGFVAMEVGVQWGRTETLRTWQAMLERNRENSCPMVIAGPGVVEQINNLYLKTANPPQEQ
jgi:hypothetical protein